MRLSLIQKKIILFLYEREEFKVNRIVVYIEGKNYSRSTYESYRRSIKNLLKKGLVRFYDNDVIHEYVLTDLGNQYYEKLVKQLTNEYQSITSLLSLMDIKKKD